MDGGGIIPRIIAGVAKGTQINAPEGNTTRPTTDRVKETVFNVINFRIPGSNVLDLFAGSGSLGLEAISRGAESCVFCDLRRKTARLIEDNVNKCHMLDKAHIVCDDYKRVLQRTSEAGQKFDIIFLDPPYSTGLLQEALSSIYNKGLLAQNGTIVAEMPVKEDVFTAGFCLERENVYGKIKIAYMRC